jgi:hypothetical protein
MKKIMLTNQTIWYSKKLGLLFYDYKKTRAFPKSTLNKKDYELFLKQLK